jgi:alpha-galactosidase
LRNKNIITGLDTEVWGGKLVDGWAVILFNRGNKDATI